MSAPKSTLNNQIINTLRKGVGEAVDPMIAFGVKPQTLLDLVLPGSSSTAVTTESAWFWSHQAPKADAVVGWWSWVNRNLESQRPADRNHTLAALFSDGLKAAIQQETGETLLATWQKSLEWTMDDRAPNWSRQNMMSHLASCCSKIGNPSEPGLRHLDRAGFITASDWTNEARQRYAQEPLTCAVNKGQAVLMDLLLDMGCEPYTQKGEPILAQVWKSFIEDVSRSEMPILDDDVISSVAMLDRLLGRGLDWNVPLHENNARTIAQDAEGWLDVLKSQPGRWKAITQHIESRILNSTTPSSKARAKSRL